MCSHPKTLSIKSAILLFLNVSVLAKVIEEEKYYESERRGYDVGPNNPNVTERVCDIVEIECKKLRDMINSEFSGYEI